MRLRHLILPAVILSYSTVALAQSDTDTVTTIKMDEVVISASKFKENKKNIAQSLQVISRREIEWSMPQTTATLLEKTGNIFVQRSQMGGGSPVLRGFEASRVLLVIDGVRMNNAIYRSGHLQNVITIDNNILDNVEVLYGPASTLYGSDALGGVMVFTTRKPRLSDNGKFQARGNIMTRYSSANNEGTGHVDFDLGFKKIAALTSVSYSKFGDLRQGAFRNPFYGDFGLRNKYVTQVNGMDSIIQNNDNNIQKFSGYSQVDILEKILFQQKDNVAHTLNLQYSASSDVPRYDRLTDIRNGRLRYAEWYYGPQQRSMAAYQFQAEELAGIFDEIKAGASYQQIEESRYQRSYRSNDLQARIDDLDVIGYNIDLRRMMKKHELITGIDGQWNKVRSTAHSHDIVTGVNSPLDTRYPDGGSSMFYTALYAQHIFKIIEDKLVLNDGVRLNYVDLQARFNNKTFFPFPYDEATQQHFAWSGNIGLVYMPATRWRFALNGSSGFRSPNIDDLGKVFESAGGVSVIVPNPNLRPEYTYNLDLNLGYTANDAVKIEASAFHTWLTNAIVMDRFSLNGADSILYDGKMTAVMANQNKARAYLYGFNAALTAYLVPGVTLYSTINYTHGRYIDNMNKEVPLDHIPPVFGKTSIMYRQKRFTGEAYAIYNGWKRLKDYSPSGEDNLVYATPHGMPAWYTLNLKAGYRLNEYIGIEMALENILDYNYRVFASGISAPGRNLVVTVRGSF